MGGGGGGGGGGQLYTTKSRPLRTASARILIFGI